MLVCWPTPHFVTLVLIFAHLAGVECHWSFYFTYFAFSGWKLILRIFQYAYSTLCFLFLWNDSSVLYAYIYIAWSFFLLICRIFFLISSYLLDTDPLLIIGIADSFSHFVDSALHFKVFICINYSLYLAPSLSCLGNIFLCQDYIDMKL